MKKKVQAKKTNFNLLPRQFQHQDDVRATTVLRSTPGLEMLTRKINELHFERAVRIEYMGNGIRLGPRQVPKLYELLRDVCRTLAYPIPEFYLIQSPTFNAFTMGSERPIMVIHSALVEQFSDEEIQFVLGHEMGHIICGHQLYRLVAEFMRIGATVIGDVTLGLGNLLSGGLSQVVLNWTRKSELSADRCGFLAVQDLEVACSALVKLAGGNIGRFGGLDLAEFNRQADEFQEYDGSFLNLLYKSIRTAGLAHPVIPKRIKELREWTAGNPVKRLAPGGGQITASEE